MFPPVPLEWATEDNYDAGADPWSGTPTKVEPTTQTKAKGFVPEEPLSAEQVNYLLHTFADTANALAAMAVTRFDPVRTVTMTLGQGNYNNGAAFNTKIRRWFIQSGANAFLATRNFGADWTTVTPGLAADETISIGVNNDPDNAEWGNMLVKGHTAATTVRRYNPTTDAWSTITTPISMYNDTVLHDEANAMWIICSTDNLDTTPKVCNSPDSTYTFTDRSAGIPAVTPTTLGHVAAKCNDIGVTLMASTSAFLRSADGGTTWTNEALPADMVSEWAFCWIQERQEWIYQAVGGAIYASPDGITWTIRCTTSPVYGLSSIGYMWDMRSIGSVVWATYNLGASGGTLGGLVYSLDGGATWGFCAAVGTDGAGVGAGNGGRGMLAVGDDSVLVYYCKDATNATSYKGVSFLRNLLPAVFATISP